MSRTGAARRMRQGPGFLALLAVLVQIVTASFVAPPAVTGASPARSALDALIAASICRSAGTSDDGALPPDHRPTHHHGPDCALCPICQALAHAQGLFAPPVIAWLAAPPQGREVRALRPAPRAPPAPFVLVGSPRGPPLLV